MKDAPGTRDYDWWLLAILAAICALGVIEIYSATHGSSLAGMQNKQLRWLVVGFILMFALSRLDYHLILDQAPILYLIGIAALIAVLAFGHTRFGAKRWIPVLGEFLQVSELVKLIIIIVLARFFAEVRTDELSLQDLIKAGLIVGLPLALILEAARSGHGACTDAFAGRRRFSCRLAVETCRRNCAHRALDASRRMARLEAVSERKSYVVHAP